MWLFSKRHFCTFFILNSFPIPNIISQSVSHEVDVCFLCIQNAEHTRTHKLREATTDQWSSFQCICFWGTEKFLLVQEGLIQITNQTPSWASLKKVCYLHTKNVTVRCLSFGMPLSRVFFVVQNEYVKPIWQPSLLHRTMHAPRMRPTVLQTVRLGWFCL